MFFIHSWGIICKNCNGGRHMRIGSGIYKRKDGRYEARYRKGINSEGKTVLASVYGRTRDEAEANYRAMQATEQAAKSQYDMAVKGASEEEKDAALAQLNRAKGAVAEVRSYMSETVLTSPISGKIAEIFPQRGELVGSGAPIMNIIDTADVWVTFNIREADYSKFMEGTTFTAFIPALDNKEVVLTVSSVKDLGSFAAWKATKVTGEFDSKTFEIKAVPNDRIEGLIGGMSVIIKK